MPPRFFAPDLTPAAAFPLPSDEAHHLTRVLRLRAGETIEVFDGRGAAYAAVLVETERDRALVRITQPLSATAVPPLTITVVQSILKGSSMDDAVRDATMMGASALQPVLSEHSVVKAAQVRRDETRERWARIALAAVKQSRRATLPSIAPVLTFDEWLGARGAEMGILFVEPSAGVHGQTLTSVSRPAAGAPVSVVLGPEGGWSAREISAAIASGCVAVSLGPMTLRAESMPVAAMAAIWAVWSGGQEG